MYPCAHASIQFHTDVYTDARTHIYKNTHTHTHTHTLSLAVSLSLFAYTLSLFAYTSLQSHISTHVQGWTCSLSLKICCNACIQKCVQTGTQLTQKTRQNRKQATQKKCIKSLTNKTDNTKHMLIRKYVRKHLLHRNRLLNWKHMSHQKYLTGQQICYKQTEHTTLDIHQENMLYRKQEWEKKKGNTPEQNVTQEVCVSRKQTFNR